MNNIDHYIQVYETGEITIEDFIILIKQYNAVHQQQMVIDVSGKIKFFDPDKVKKYAGIINNFK